MSTRIALLRGINVVGRNKLAMKDLVQHLEALGLEDVKTYIQSGNAVFRAPEESLKNLGDEIAATIEKRHGFRPRILILATDELKAAIEANPFPEAAADPKTLHLFFLAEPPEAPDVEALERTKAASERFHLTERVFYLHAPDGIGRSKLAANAEKYLGVAATARNWRTVQKLREMASCS